MSLTQTAEKILAMSPQELTDWLTEAYVRDLIYIVSRELILSQIPIQ